VASVSLHGSISTVLHNSPLRHITERPTQVLIAGADDSRVQGGPKQ